MAEPLAPGDHLILAERALLATNMAIDRILSPPPDATPPTPADLQGVLFALSVSQTHASIANAQLMNDLIAVIGFAAGRGGGIQLVRG